MLAVPQCHSTFGFPLEFISSIDTALWSLHLQEALDEGQDAVVADVGLEGLVQQAEEHGRLVAASQVRVQQHAIQRPAHGAKTPFNPSVRPPYDRPVTASGTGSGAFAFGDHRSGKIILDFSIRS